MTEVIGSQVLDYSVTGGVAWVRLNRPSTRNAIDRELRRALVNAVGQAERDPEARVVVLAGAGNAFCAGADVRELGESPPAEVRNDYETLLSRLRAMPKPTIAVVRGAAAGIGVALACCCDMRYAASDAFFRVAFVDIGLTVDGGVSWLLPRLIGLGRTYEMCYTARRVPADEAERWGLVNRVLAPEELEGAVQELAEQLARGPARALGAIKRSVSYAAASSFEEAMDFEFLLQGVQLRGEDFKEGVRAFVEKRKPRFQGR